MFGLVNPEKKQLDRLLVELLHDLHAVDPFAVHVGHILKFQVELVALNLLEDVF